jgi:predicted membrane protein
MSDFNPHQFRDELTDDIHRRMRRRRDRFRHRRRHSPVGGVIIGTAILLAGVLFLLENFGLVHVYNIWAYWPVIMIAWGIAGMTGAGHPSGRIWGGVIAVVGGLLLLSNLHIITENVWRIVWPLLLILAGLRMLYRSARRRGRRDHDNFPPTSGQPGAPEGMAPPSGAAPEGGTRATDTRPGHLDEWAVFGGSRRRVDSQDFKGGEAFAMFGGVELDLRAATIVQDEVLIDASALFGGVDLQVPENWNVSVEGHGIFGGYEDQTHHAMPESARPRVVITGSAVFGGVVVKN